MSFQDIEAGLSSSSPSQIVPQSPEESAFLTLQSSLSLQVFKLNYNVQGILKLVDQLGTQRDSATLRKSLCVYCFSCSSVVTDLSFYACSHDLTETTRAMVKRGSEDLKKLATLQAPLVSTPFALTEVASVRPVSGRRIVACKLISPSLCLHREARCVNLRPPLCLRTMMLMYLI